MRVRYYGHFGHPTGYGRAAVDYALALTRHRPDIELDLRHFGGGALEGRSLPLAPLVNRDGRPDVVLVHTLPSDCPTVLGQAYVEGLDPATPAVAYTTWEAITLPDAIRDGLVRFKRILTPAWLDGFEGNGWMPLPHCFDEERPLPPRDNDGRVFMFYTVGAWNVRKNPQALIRAFAHAFGDRKRKDVALSIHAPGADELAFRMAMYATGCAELPVFLSRGVIDDDLIWKRHVDGDCFVSASRGEAWNMGAFEAAIAGRRLIVPSGHGTSRFLNHTYAHRYRTIRAPAHLDVSLHHRHLESPDGGLHYNLSVRGPRGLTSRDVWLEPDEDALAASMSFAYQNRHNDRRMPVADLAAEFGYAAVAPQLARDLEEVANTI